MIIGSDHGGGHGVSEIGTARPGTARREEGASEAAKDISCGFLTTYVALSDWHGDWLDDAGQSAV